jgi:hypothetical protein
MIRNRKKRGMEGKITFIFCVWEGLGRGLRGGFEGK